MRQWHLQPTCAVTGDGLHEGMERLREMILRRRRQNGRIGGGGFLNVKLPLSSGAGAASGARTPTRNKVRRSHSYHH